MKTSMSAVVAKDFAPECFEGNFTNASASLLASKVINSSLQYNRKVKLAVDKAVTQAMKEHLDVFAPIFAQAVSERCRLYKTLSVGEVCRLLDFLAFGCSTTSFSLFVPSLSLLLSMLPISSLTLPHLRHLSSLITAPAASSLCTSQPSAGSFFVAFSSPHNIVATTPKLIEESILFWRTNVLCAPREVASMEHQHVWGVFLKQHMSKEALAQVIPDFTRMLRRSPEVSAHNVAWAVEYLTPERVREVQQSILGDLVSILASSRQNVREAGARLCKAFAQASVPASLAELVKTVLGSLTSGAAGNNIDSRIGVANGVVSLVQYTGTEVIAQLTTVCNAESNFDVKTLLVSAFGSLGARGIRLPSDVLTLLLSIARDEAKPVQLRVAALVALQSSLTTPEQLADADATLSQLSKLAVSSVDVLKSHVMVLPLLYPCVTAALKDSAKYEKLWKAVAPSFLFSEKSTLNSEPFFDKTPDAVKEISLLTMLQIFSCLNDGDQDAAAPLLRTFCALFSALPHKLHKTAVLAARKVINSKVSVSVWACRHALTQKVEGQLVLLPFLKQRGNEPQPPPPPHAVLDTVQLFAEPDLSDDDLALLCLAMHHPLAQPTPTHVAWEKTYRRVTTKRKNRGSNIVSRLMSHDGIWSLNPDNVIAAQAGVTQVCSYDADSCFQASLLISKTWKQCKSALSVTEREMGIYRTPEGKLFEEPVLDEYVPEVVEGKKKDADEAWAEEVRREIAAKKKGEDKGQDNAKGTLNKRDAALEEARARQKIVEDVIRKRICSLDVLVSGTLKAIIAVASATTCGFHAGSLLYKAFVLLGSRLGSQNAAAAVKATGMLARVASQFGYQHRAIVALVQLRSVTSVKRDTLLASWSACTILGVVVSHLKEQVLLDSSSLVLVFCLMESLMALENPPVTFYGDAVSVLEAHSSSGDVGIPRGAICSFLATLFSKNNPLAARCAAAMKNFGVHFVDDDLELLLESYAMVSEPPLRDAILQACLASPIVTKGAAPSTIRAVTFLAKHDTDASVAALGSEMWKLSGLKPFSSAEGFEGMQLFLRSSKVWVRTSASAALASIAAEAPANSDALVNLLLNLFNKPASNADVKVGIAAGIVGLARSFSVNTMLRVVQWIAKTGLFDDDQGVRIAFTDAGAAVISRGPTASCIDELWTLLDQTMKFFEKVGPKDKAPVVEKKRLAQQACVVLVASLACHMEASDPRLGSIISSLLDSISASSSEQLQQSMSQQLGPLMAMLPEDQVPAYVKRLIKACEHAKDVSVRRGAAWAMAGLVKGRKLPALKKFDILKEIERLLKDKKKSFAREGALVMVECLVRTLGQGFEAYYIFLLQHLLDRYGDTSAEVREAAEKCSKVIMSNLSPGGVRLVLGPLLKSLSGNDWRRKRGGIELLGSMAFINPAQLSLCLPSIVPVLMQVLTDPHVKVQEAAYEAFQNISGVISNPEIKDQVPLILKCFNDPEAYTETLLKALLNTHFVHVVDAPSLALLMPAVTRAFWFRNQEAKLMASQIVGNIGSLTKPADLVPYLGSLTVELQKLLTDPSPDLRVAAANACGTLLRGMGESKFPDLVVWLFNNFEQTTLSSVRAGCALGLGEVLNAVPQDRFDVLFKEVVERTDHVNAGVREGSLLTVSCMCKLDASSKRMEDVMPKLAEVLLRGLSEEVDEVRASAVEMGHALLARFWRTHLEDLFPQLESGIFSTSWRTRIATLSLLGELLHICSGGSADAAAAVQDAKLVENLGAERRDRLLAAIYVIRCDSNSTIKHQALGIWKRYVVNPPKTVKRVTPFLMKMIVSCLGSSDPDLRDTAGRALGDVVERLSEKVIPTVLPVLVQSKDGSPSARQGACLGLTHLIRSSNKHQMTAYVSSVIKFLVTNLLDEDDGVRSAAADAFVQALDKGGEPVMSGVVESLLDGVSKGSATADASICKIASLVPYKVVPVVIPKLLPEGSAIPLWSIQLLGRIANVSGPQFARKLSVVLPALAAEKSSKDAAIEAALDVALSIQEEDVYLLVEALLDLTRGTSEDEVAFACTIMGRFCKQFGAVEEFLERFIDIVLMLYLDTRSSVLDAACASLNLLVESIPGSSEDKYVIALQRSVQQLRFNQIKAGVNPGDVPGLNRPAGLKPLLNLLKQGIMSGSTPEIKEQAAATVSEVLRLCTASCIQSSTVMQLAPIIRVVGEKVPASVKKAVLSSLNVLLELVPTLLQALVPQLQTVFVRSLQEPEATVREEAAVALGRLMGLNPRVDPLANELCGSILSSAAKIRHSMLLALIGVLQHAGSKITEKVLEKVFSTLEHCRVEPSCNADERTRELTSVAFGELAAVCPSAMLDTIFSTTIAGAKKNEENLRDVNFLILSCIASALKHGTTLDKYIDQVLSLLTLPADSVVTWKSKSKALHEWAIVNLRAFPANLPEILRAIVASLVVEDRELRVEVLKNIKIFAKLAGTLKPELLSILVPPVFEKAQDKKSFPVKIAGERALLHLLCIKTDKTVLANYVKNLDEPDRKELLGYVSKVIVKLGDSDDENQGA